MTDQMNAFDTADFFTDPVLCEDPYPFFERLRSRGPVTFEPHHGVAMVAGYNEALSVYNDASNFSACVAVSGPIPPISFSPVGDDISEQIRRHRHELPSSDLLVTYDRPEHPPARSLLMRLFTPRRLAENEAYLRSLAERLIDGVLEATTAEVVSELGNPFATLVIADLLGIPEEDREIYRNKLTAVPAPVGDASAESFAQHPLAFLHESFTRYIEERRAKPTGDVLSDLATARYPDESTPSVLEVVRVATNLFAAGQETTARLLATALRILAERPALQSQLRAQPGLIPNFIEEVLRLEGPIKNTFRLTSKTTKIGDTPVKAGTTVMVAIPSINRDPSRYEKPDDIVLDRPKIREHLAFGRGVHTCPGASLARVEVRVMLEQLLARTSKISLSESHHGTEGARRYNYAATYLIRGLNALHLNFTI
jgi:cytochrome P450